MLSVFSIISLVTFLSQPSDSLETDYCKVDRSRCTKEGIYRYKWATGYDDFVIRDILDDDVETIQSEPWLAAQKSNETLIKYPNSPRAILNQLNVLRNSNQKKHSHFHQYSPLSGDTGSTWLCGHSRGV